jgi:hypothetical protein
VIDQCVATGYHTDAFDEHNFLNSYANSGWILSTVLPLSQNANGYPFAAKYYFYRITQP